MAPELSAPVAPEAPWRAGVRGARANLWPGIALQIGALALVIAYYRHTPTREALEHLAVWRTHLGLVYSIVSTALFAGAIPVLYLWANPATRSTYNVKQAVWLVGFWAYKGVEIDLWYRLLAHVIGEGTDARTIIIKTFLDQCVYCPIFAVPLTMFGYEFAALGLDFRAFVADVRAGSWYRRRVLPPLIANLGIWLPAVCIIYALPTPLQLPLQNLVMCFFTLILVHVTRRHG
ncbi:hypothetical protein K0B96_00740 [Horticoccus luteus]|uniref:Uncharacterized protein n=1 Tax=Horticoccus luteus TaxID=2862869 RepID=A0A8F9TW20_9BACT|nr:hypothetical protein [Horticoccus luteus]QYM79175.1 hypothetical protein K0B96_00740 [Horticoccus luteus]